MADGSLVRRTRRLTVAVAGLSVAVVFLVFYVAWTSFTIASRTDELSRQARVIASGIEASSADDLAGGVRERLFRVEAGLIGAMLALTDDSGHAVLSSAQGPDEARSYPVDRLGEPDELGVRSTVADVDGVGRVLMVAAPIEGREDASLLVAVQPLREVNRTQGWVALLLGASAAVAIAVGWVAGGWSARRLAGPVVRLEGAAEAVRSGDWGRQVPVEGDDEVASLARAFNRMSERVAAAYGAQKEFVGNVSHEMRTPVTTIAGFAGALVDGTVSDDATRERYLGVIRDEAARLGELARVLLELADLDAGAVTPDLRRVELADVSRALCDRHGVHADRAGVSLDLDGLSGVVESDPRLLTQALSILVENAIRYTPADGEVRCSAVIEGGEALLWVDDSGPGVPEDRRADVFERFVRLESSRSKEQGGSGLGLAICGRLVEILGGRVWVEASALGGARFVIALPA